MSHSTVRKRTPHPPTRRGGFQTRPLATRPLATYPHMVSSKTMIPCTWSGITTNASNETCG